MLCAKHGSDNLGIGLCKAWIFALGKNLWISCAICGFVYQVHRVWILDNPWINCPVHIDSNYERLLVTKMTTLRVNSVENIIEVLYKHHMPSVVKHYRIVLILDKSQHYFISYYTLHRLTLAFFFAGRQRTWWRPSAGQSIRRKPRVFTQCLQCMSTVFAPLRWSFWPRVIDIVLLPHFC